ncbi:N-6 DNA methylase [Micromonospora sp. WMMD754]|uniref:N-6 DNA methylase n=1 Tax=Micromonospora sp. WMMD754 TaxID=3404114 RepID=UPI003BF5232E
MRLQQGNPDVFNEVLDAVDASKRLDSGSLASMIEAFDGIPTGPEDVEFPDTVGRAYDQVLTWLAERSGKKGGEFHTPRSVCQLLVRLINPEAGQAVCDPFAGTGGTLLQSRQYVSENSGGEASLALFGQEINMLTWATARINLMLHGLANGSLLRGDTLADPLHKSTEGTLLRFDRVLTNPPFGMNYAGSRIRYPERMKYGWAPGQGKRADLMSLQHVLAVLKPDGIGAVVAPHGVLFRGGAEAGVRRAILEDNRLEAVIGIGPNVFHGTAIPACILVVRGTGAPADGGQGPVLFINAEQEITTGRSQNKLDPQHVEKIARTFRSKLEITGFSRLASLAEIADNEFNLNIGRYVESGPVGEVPVDISATLYGGVPRAEVEAIGPWFKAFDIDIAQLFQSRGSGCLDFLDGEYEETASRIREAAAPRERAITEKCHEWWETAATLIIELAGNRRLMTAREKLLASFCTKLLPVGVLNRDQLAGVFAIWWSDHHDDLRRLDYYGLKAAHAQSSGATPSGGDLLTSLVEDLCARVENLVGRERQALEEKCRAWFVRYGVSLADLEQQCEAAAMRRKARLKDLGFGTLRS